MPLSRADDCDAMAALGQAVNETAQRHGDAVYLGSVSFGNKGKVQVLDARSAVGPAVEQPQFARQLCQNRDDRVTIQ